MARRSPALAMPSVSSGRIRSPAASAGAGRVTMEKRAILAAVLMAGLLIVYQAYFFPSGQQPPSPQQEQQPQAPIASKDAPAPAPPPTAPASAPTSKAPAPRPPQRTARVEGPLYRALF